MTVWDSLKLDGRRALVTGGSRGLGLEMARALGEAGADLVLVGRDAEQLAAAQRELARPARPGFHFCRPTWRSRPQPRRCASGHSRITTRSTS